jgi:hypothetical protein
MKKTKISKYEFDVYPGAVQIKKISLTDTDIEKISSLIFTCKYKNLSITISASTKEVTICNFDDTGNAIKLDWVEFDELKELFNIMP